MSKGNILGSENISKLILKFAFPSIISLLVSSAYNITDQIFIGNVVGMLGNAATNVAFPIVTFTTALAQFIGVGTAANFNISMGEKKRKQGKKLSGKRSDSFFYSLHFYFDFFFNIHKKNSHIQRSHGYRTSLSL